MAHRTAPIVEDLPDTLRGPRARTTRGPDGDVTFRRRVTRIDGLTIASWVSEHDPQHAPGTRGFVLVHGIGVSARYFRPLAARLARYGPVHAIDLAGFGSSPRVIRDVDMAGHALVVGAYARHHGLERPVVVGHSMGGQVVVELLATDPDLTDQGVIIGSTVDPEADTLLRQSLRLGLDFLREPPRVALTILSDYVFRCGVVHYLRQVRHLLRHETESTAVRVRASLLVVRGYRDPVCPLRWARRLADAAPRGTLAEVPGPHVVMFSATEQLTQLILERSRSAA